MKRVSLGSINQRIGRFTAIGFASVLTNSDVTLRVRDMMRYERASDWFWEGMLRDWVIIRVSLQLARIDNHPDMLATA